MGCERYDVHFFTMSRLKSDDRMENKDSDVL